ncbi:polyphosphate kinase 2 family protein [uncultured Paludibaculum sp.]|uniref:polyphosphate kinase 2 family protein n=1 Tax=uncultured Paludibaculum sp. TaxID=1765020 RepID=UPI002AAB4AC4|nr:polyphosphate kinase 2 family protein [uncultured Paludibaculum sp.]
MKKPAESRIDSLADRMIVPPGKKKLSIPKDFDAAWKPKSMDKKQATAALEDGIRMLAAIQDKLYAQDNYALLVIFQAMDAAGKDGAIKHVMSGINPQGCQVYSFKAPSNEELDHDYLWRCFKALPERGRIGIFNRSYYEEVLVTKVHPAIIESQKLPAHLKDKKIYQRRYREINNFEEYLHNNGIITLKFFLNVSRDEQKKRFLERIDRDEKNWKFSASDAKERSHWDEYMQAYAECIRATSTKNSPWYVIPADNKWVSRLAVAGIMYQTLKGLKLEYPTVSEQQKQALTEAKRLLEAEK